mgnify:CR=1 FL=1
MHINIKIILLCLLTLIPFQYLKAQIVNMESARKESLLGSHFQLNLGLNGSSGTVDRTNYSLATRLDNNSEKWQNSMENLQKSFKHNVKTVRDPQSIAEMLVRICFCSKTKTRRKIFHPKVQDTLFQSVIPFASLLLGF